MIATTDPLRTQAAGTVRRGPRQICRFRTNRLAAKFRDGLADTTSDIPIVARRMTMPLLCFDLIQGRSENQIKRILDVTHEVMVTVFNVPGRDRYQIVREHAPSRMIIEDTGLGIERTPNMLSFKSRPALAAVL